MNEDRLVLAEELFQLRLLDQGNGSSHHAWLDMFEVNQRPSHHGDVDAGIRHLPELAGGNGGRNVFDLLLRALQGISLAEKASLPNVELNGMFGSPSLSPIFRPLKFKKHDPLVGDREELERQRGSVLEEFSDPRRT